MGIQDRDYYWEDRKRRENKFSKKDTYYRPKEHRSQKPSASGRPPGDWTRSNKEKFRHQVNARPERRGLIKGMILGLAIGTLVTFWTTLAILHINADLLWVPYEATREALSALGIL